MNDNLNRSLSIDGGSTCLVRHAAAATLAALTTIAVSARSGRAEPRAGRHHAGHQIRQRVGRGHGLGERIELGRLNEH